MSNYIYVEPGYVPMGWIGTDPLGSGATGAWFKKLWIGGTSTSNAPIVADSSGNVTINGASLTVDTSASGSSITTAITTSAILSSYTGLSVSGANGQAGVLGNSGTFGFFAADSSGDTWVALEYSYGGSPSLTLQTWSGGSVVASATLLPNELKITGLPSSSPGAGTKQFYYNPSTNVVYFAA